MFTRKRSVGGEGEEEVSVHAAGSLAKKHCSISSSGNVNNNSGSSIVETPITSLVNGSSTDIDEDLHSRQLAVYGRETMRKLFASNILISGMQGLGAEIAKNLILAGVKSVTLHDEGVVELWDLSSNFIFSEKDVGKNRALASIQKLQDLNNDVLISTLTTELTKERLSDFQAVVFTDISIEKAVEFNDYCHNHQPPIAFIKSEVRGLFGSVFCDFGPEFTVVDVDGNEPHSGIIAYITNKNPALVACVYAERLEFEDGDMVMFSEVHGMAELNDGKPRKVKNARPFSFFIEEDTTQYGAYVKGGIVTQVKQPKILNFKPLREAIKDPGDFLLSDFSKFDRPPVLHLAFQALDKYVSELGRLPVSGSEEDAKKFISLVTHINDGLADGKLEEIDYKLLQHFAFGARAVLNPMAAMFGGIVGQEVLKACSGKFHPLFQFFYFDSLESLPTELDPSDLKPVNSRYDAQISVFGHKLQKKLEDAKVFVVGSGALGCEFLKNLALMGVCCSTKGKLTISDDDVIKKSNLSSQFLFRDRNIGDAKSTVAASAAALINPRFNVEALQNRARPDTENVFNDTFWENLSAVINALDNVNARLYIDQRCLYFQKPLLESGTLGAKCNTQMVIPHLTENYGASRDPADKQASMNTVHSFPHNIDHCLTWARSEFEGLLEKTPAEVNAYLINPSEYTSGMIKAGDAQARDNLERVLECLANEKCETVQDCITWARLRFEDYFANRVKQLTYTFPEYATTSNGASFWFAPKRFPRPLQCSVDDMSHLHFIMVASVLRAETFGIPIPEWVKSPTKLADAINKVTVPDFQPKKDTKIVSISTASIKDADVINELIMKLEECSKQLSTGFKINPIQFEKDNDTNYHMDLIVGLANMRARNYGIPEVDKLKAKFIVGRIIPAIATATAMATGFVCLELYKVLDGGHKLEDYRNTFANLALPLFSIAEPVPPKVIKHQNMSWTVWDRWVLREDLTLHQVLQWLENKGLNAYRISYGSCLLYNSMVKKHVERMDKKMVDLAREVAKAELPPDRRHFDIVVACKDKEDNDIDIPQVSVYFNDHLPLDLTENRDITREARISISRKRWSFEDTEELVTLLEKHGFGDWVKIQSNAHGISDRTPQNLRDKWANLRKEKTGALKGALKGEENKFAALFARINALIKKEKMEKELKNKGKKKECGEERKMSIWGTSAGNKELCKMLIEWTVAGRQKYANKPLSSTCLSEAESFLEKYAKRNPEIQALIGSAGNSERAKDFLAIVEGVREEGDLEKELEVPTSISNPSAATKPEGLLVFFPGIPEYARTALCTELLNTPGEVGDLPVYILTDNLFNGNYWGRITLVDKDAPEEVWGQIEDICRGAKARAVPVVPDSAGTEDNLLSLDALAIFMFRVLQQVNHSGNLDEACVLLKFYNLYEGKSRGQFDFELGRRFGSLIKMPLLESPRDLLPDPLESVLVKGIDLYHLHIADYGSEEGLGKGLCADQWDKWERKLLEALSSNEEYLKSIQVPFDHAAQHVLKKLKKIANGDDVDDDDQSEELI